MREEYQAVTHALLDMICSFFTSKYGGTFWLFPSLSAHDRWLPAIMGFSGSCASQSLMLPRMMA